MKSLFLSLLLCLAVSVQAQKRNATSTASNRRPNIIFILVDGLGWKDVGFIGNTYHETRNIDKLSEEGILFTNAYSNAPNCAPTRVSLLSGWYPPRHGIYTVNNSDRGETENRKLIPITNTETLDSSVVTFPELLKSAGYTTAIFGKWHLGSGKGTSPEGQGFDVNIGGNDMGAPKSYFSPYKNPSIKDGPVGEDLTNRLTNDAISFIDGNKNKPFFLYLGYYAVHTPIQGKKELIEKYKNKVSLYERSNATYAAMLDNVDQNIGKLLTRVEETGLEKNTIVIFYSDAGPFFPVSTAAPLRGTKGTMYEGGVRVPLIVKWPANIKANSVSNEPVISIDFFPTFLKICYIQKPANKVLDGVDISPLLFDNGSLKRDKLYRHFPAYPEKNPGMKETWRATPSSSIRKGDWKLIEFFEDNKIELFHLKEDIGEKNEVSKINPAEAKELLNDLVQWRKDLNAPVPTELNPAYKAK